MVAMPSMISPSVGIISPVSQINTSPLINEDELTTFISLAIIFFAGVSSRVLRREFACAFPRASAIASAKFANNKVRNRITNIEKLYPTEPSEVSFDIIL